MVDGGVSGVKALGLLGDFAKIAYEKGWLKRIRDLFRKSHRILVLGATGTGKTQMIESFNEHMPDAIHYMDRTVGIRSHRVDNIGEAFKIIDTPGEEERSKAKRMDAIKEALRKGVSGIIDVVSYGYHEYDVDIGAAFNLDGSVNADFLEAHRAAEGRALREWTAILGDRKTTGWLITVVNKADLWWDRKDEVLEHYKSGTYSKSLGDARSLGPIVLPYCSVCHRFFGEGRLSGAFDDSDRNMLRSHMLQSLLEVVGKVK